MRGPKLESYFAFDGSLLAISVTVNLLETVSPSSGLITAPGTASTALAREVQWSFFLPQEPRNLRVVISSGPFHRARSYNQP